MEISITWKEHRYPYLLIGRKLIPKRLDLLRHYKNGKKLNTDYEKNS